MSKKISPTLIGTFVVCGVLLTVGALILFGSFEWFKKTDRAILYFGGSLNGLVPGATVKYRGVDIGSVKEVLIHRNQSRDDPAMPVIIEIERDLLRRKMDQEALALRNDTMFKAAVDQGLRGKLGVQSLVTGLLYVELAFVPDAPPPKFHQLTPRLREIPTIPTQLEVIEKAIATLDIKGIAEKLNRILTKTEATLDGVQMQQISGGIQEVLAAVRDTVRDPEVARTIATAHQTLIKLNTLTDKLIAGADPALGELHASLAGLSKTLDETSHLIASLRHVIAPRSPVQQQMIESAAQVERAARAISTMVELLNRNPNALLSGIKHPEDRK